MYAYRYACFLRRRAEFPRRLLVYRRLLYMQIRKRFRILARCMPEHQHRQRYAVFAQLYGFAQTCDRERIGAVFL